MTFYVPGTGETDAKKQNMSLQQIGGGLTTAVANVATNTADIATANTNIATNTANIATNTTNIAANTSAIAANTSAITALTGKNAPDVIIEDQKSSATVGGTSSTGSNTRTLNTLVRNVSTLASLSSNQFSLPAGTYYIRWSAPIWRGDQHQTVLRNVTDSSNVASGTPEYAPSATDSSQTRSVGSVTTTIAGTKAFSILHNVTTGRATNGLGLAGGFGSTEVYTRVEIWRLA